jgi:hypothetical protein
MQAQFDDAAILRVPGSAGAGIAEDLAQRVDGRLPEAEPVPVRPDGEAELHPHRTVREQGRAGELVVDLLLESRGLA